MINGYFQNASQPCSLLLFVSAALLLLAIPGSAIFYIVGRSIGQGRGAGLASAVGVGVGSLVHVREDLLHNLGGSTCPGVGNNCNNNSFRRDNL